MLPTTDRVLVNDVCVVVLTAAGLKQLWTKNGPAAELEARTAGLTAAQKAVVRFVIDLWSGDGALALGCLVATADANYLVVVGTLLVAIAYGDQGLRDWVDVHCEERLRAGASTIIH